MTCHTQSGDLNKWKGLARGEGTGEEREHRDDFPGQPVAVSNSSSQSYNDQGNGMGENNLLLITGLKDCSYIAPYPVRWIAQTLHGTDSRPHRPKWKEVCSTSHARIERPTSGSGIEVINTGHGTTIASKMIEGPRVMEEIHTM